MCDDCLVLGEAMRVNDSLAREVVWSLHQCEKRMRDWPRSLLSIPRHDPDNRTRQYYRAPDLYTRAGDPVGWYTRFRDH